MRIKHVDTFGCHSPFYPNEVANVGILMQTLSC